MLPSPGMDAPVRSRTYRLGLWCDSRLEQVAVRALLSIAIIASLLPIEAIEQPGVELAFSCVFFVEFLMRCFAVSATTRTLPSEGLGAAVDANDRTAGQPKQSRASAVLLLVLDAVALLSFLPLPVGADGARWLRVVRLLRMVALAGYWAPLLRDLWTILSRRERLRQIVLMGVVVGGLSFAGALILHHAHDEPFDADEDGVLEPEDRSFWVLLWWSFRQVQDPGNMLESPHAASVVVVSLMLTVFGLLLISFLIGLGSDVVHELVEHSRMRPPGFTGHTVLVNITPSTRTLLRELLAYYKKLFPTDARFGSRRWFADLRRRGLAARYIVIGKDDDAPEFLRAVGPSRVVYRVRPDDEEELLSRADLLGAKRVLLLADVHDPTPDAETIRMLLTLVERVRARERRRYEPAPARTRVVIAEIHDESNVNAAHAALATAGRSFRGWVVPTEKLLGLFFAGVVRRPGLGDLLGVLLTSRGHEIYTCFFDTPGLGFQVQRPADLGGSCESLMRRLAIAGERAGGSRGPVIPIGLLLDRGDGSNGFEVVLNPPREREVDPTRVRGLVGLADEFGPVRRWIELLRSEQGSTPMPAGVEGKLPALARTHRTKTTRVLVCGFRPGTIYLLEELFRSDPTGEVLVLVTDAAAAKHAAEAIDGHTHLVRRNLLPGRHGIFEAVAAGHWRACMVHDLESTGRLRIEVADWMASRWLVELPADFGHVAQLDAIVFVASEGEATDPRTTTALLKLEELCMGPPGVHRPSVVAEVFDDALAARLSARARELGHGHVQVYSSQELRAFFLFQAVVVPGFDNVYEELLGAWGQSLVHTHVTRPGQGRCSFAALGMHLRELGEILVALELVDARGRVRLVVAPGIEEEGGYFAAEQLRGAWVIAPDSGRLHAPHRAARHPRPHAEVAERAGICEPSGS